VKTGKEGGYIFGATGKEVYSPGNNFHFTAPYTPQIGLILM